MKETQDQNPDSHIDYDESEHTVYIKVSDNMKGAMVAEVSYDNEENAPPIFINSYTSDEYQLKITGTKRLVGRRLRNNEFVFEVRNSLGEVVATAKNAANGSITFPTIKLDSAVHELEGDLDDTVYTVKVTVTNDDGVLSAQVNYPANGVAIVNEYESSVPETGEGGVFLLYLSMLCVSCGAIISLAILHRKNESAC